MYIHASIGIVIGVLLGAAAVWVLDRRHQKTVDQLIESRRKIERQRTQAVNDLFAFRAEAGGETATRENTTTGSQENRESEVDNLRVLLSRADAALGSARAQRDAQAVELIELRSQLESLTGDKADVIDLHPRTERYNVQYGRV